MKIELLRQYCSYQNFYSDSSHLEYLIYLSNNQFDHTALFSYLLDSDFYNNLTNYKNNISKC